MNNKIILYGAGGHAKVVKECLEAQDNQLFGFVDDNPDARLFQLTHLGIYHSEVDNDALFIVAIGNNEIRKRITEKISHSFTTVIHSTAVISPSARIGNGCMIFHRAIIQASTIVGNQVIVNTGAQIDHDGLVGDYAHIGPGAVLCGDVSVGEGTLVGAGAVVLPGVKIGKWSVIGAGAVVTRTVPDHATVYGNPAAIKDK